MHIAKEKDAKPKRTDQKQIQTVVQEKTGAIMATLTL